jgi:hypothetical protein
VFRLVTTMSSKTSANSTHQQPAAMGQVIRFPVELCCPPVIYAPRPSNGTDCMDLPDVVHSAEFDYMLRILIYVPHKRTGSLSCGR